MSRNKNSDIQKSMVAVAASGGQVGALVGTKVDATGYSRAHFIFNFGNGAATTAALSAGIGPWQASTSGATYAAIASASLAAVTSGVLSSTSVTLEVDVPISAGTPWLLVSGGSLLSTAVPHSCVVELYNGINRPPTASSTEVVTV